jgi:cell pole-organizing protein PopZ
MPDAKSRTEPTMEEIIASISRVIAEDRHPGDPRAGEGQRGARVTPSPPEESDILELTQVVEEDGSLRRITRRSAAEAAPSDASAKLSEPRASAPVTPIEPRGPATNEPTLGSAPERIVSTAASGAAAAAFAQLGSLPRERRREAELPPGGAERILEDMVREMLRPMLQSWLDEHLPGMVERLVREEIARVVGESGLR